MERFVKDVNGSGVPGVAFLGSGGALRSTMGSAACAGAGLILWRKFSRTCTGELPGYGSGGAGESTRPRQRSSQMGVGDGSCYCVLVVLGGI